MCHKRYTYQKFGIEYPFIAILDHLDRKRVHMVYDDSIYWVALNAHIATVIAKNNLLPNFLPFAGTIQRLIQISIEAESRFADCAV